MSFASLDDNSMAGLGQALASFAQGQGGGGGGGGGGTAQTVLAPFTFNAAAQVRDPQGIMFTGGQLYPTSKNAQILAPFAGFVRETNGFISSFMNSYMGSGGGGGGGGGMMGMMGGMGGMMGGI